MKKHTLTSAFLLLTFFMVAQTPRLSLYEEFTGETCPPCAATNPGLNTLLASPTNTPKIVAIKWQVPIPSAPTNTWSLYQTNKIEIDWRWKTIAAGGYGYNPAINSAPSSKIDGQEATIFGATSGHPANLNNNVISAAAAVPAAFSINMTRAWDQTYSSVNLTVNIAATQTFSPQGNLVFRLVMIERHIHFAVQPGTNGETDFDDVAVKSYPTLQAGTPMAAGTWTNGQSQTFTINCVLPSYIRDKSEIAFVGFIQDDGNRKVAQVGLANKAGLLNDAQAVSVALPNLSCSNSVMPQATVKNNGTNAITAFTITPYIDGAIKPTFTWAGNLAVGSSTTLALNSETVIGGSHTYSYTISSVSGTDNNLANNSAKTAFVIVSNYQTSPIVEGFSSVTFPPLNWATYNPTSGPTWIKSNACGGFGLSPESTKMDFYNYAVGTVNELIMPPINLTGATSPTLTFDVAYTQYSNETDLLEVLFSTDCGANWTSAYNKSGSALSTAPITTAAFVPNATQWRKESVLLLGANNASVLLKFKATSDYGNNLYIDNVNLSQPPAPSYKCVNKVCVLDAAGTYSSLALCAAANCGGVGLNEYNFAANSFIYPNPTSESANLFINLKDNAPVEISVMSALGHLVKSVKSQGQVGENTIHVDLSGLSSGIYLVNVKVAGTISTKKLTVNK